MGKALLGAGLFVLGTAAAVGAPACSSSDRNAGSPSADAASDASDDGMVTADATADATGDGMPADVASDASSDGMPAADVASDASDSAAQDAQGPDGTSAEGGSDSGVTDAAGCGAQAVCIPPAPAGWTGPLLLVTAAGGTTPPCTSAYPTLVQAEFADLTFSPAQCTCGPATAQLSACWGSANISVGIATGCGGYQGSIYTDSTCAQPQFSGFYAYAGYAAVETAESQLVCKGQLTGQMLPPVSWGSASSLCAPPAPTAQCSGGSCYPPPGGPVCIYQTGSQSCPAPFTNAQTLYGTYDDSRYCGCSTDYVGGGCAGSLQFFGNSACTGQNASVTLPVSSCTDVGNFFQVDVAAQFVATAITGQCPQPTASANGTVTATDAVTVCCL